MPHLRIDQRTIPFQGILFDKDGTLLDFIEFWGEWARVLTTQVQDYLSSKGSQLLGSEAKLLGIHFSEKGEMISYDPKGPIAMATEEETIAILAWQLYAAGVPWNEAVQKVREMASYAMKTIQEHPKAVPTPGLIPLLKRCKEQGVTLAVVTTDRTAEAIAHLEYLGIRSFFNVIVGRDRVSQGKPEPEMLELACMELGLKPEEVLVIGDTDVDMQMGRKGGAILTVGFAPNGGTDHLINADTIIAHYDELRF